MRSLDANVPRRNVVEAYVHYDATKKKNRLLDFAGCDWDDPNCLDSVLRRAKYKCGIIAGFSVWSYVEISLDDLRDCAVVAALSNKLKGPRDLRGLETKGCLHNWKPDIQTTYFERVEHGDTFGPGEPFILCPSVQSELPAKWYIEDGSGRATALVANAAKYVVKPVVGYGYLGIRADQTSTFMKQRYADLV